MAARQIIRPCQFCGNDFAAKPSRHQRFCSTSCGLRARPKRELTPAEDRFWPKVSVQSNGCWLWIGAKNDLGYGMFSPNGRAGRRVRAHRWAYEYLIGEIPVGLEPDHLCRNPLCVNPTHLEPVTHRENVLRGDSLFANHARQTHCKRGHPFNESNTYRYASGGRKCRRCNREFMRRQRDSRLARITR